MKKMGTSWKGLDQEDAWMKCVFIIVMFYIVYVFDGGMDNCISATSWRNFFI